MHDMKKVLIVIYDMRIGGAQKSLLSFLQEFAEKGKMKEYQVDLLPFNSDGVLMREIPEGIHVIQADPVFRWLGSRLNLRLLRHFSWRGLLGEARWLLRRVFKLNDKQCNIQQQVWQSWKSVIPPLAEKYDTAVAYLDGVAGYYIMDKVQADKKVLWLHSDYDKQQYNAAYDKKYYEGCQEIITVSEECREKLMKHFPDCAGKMHVLENISSYRSIMKKSRQGTAEEFDDAPGVKILSVGRLNWQKGMDIAVEAAACLEKAGLKFRWLIVGEGSEREKLEKQIDALDVQDCIWLTGARENPYTYMRACDLLVQPSRIEGKSIVLDEIKMFDKPIVAAAYPTVYDAITHEETGIITEISGQALCEGILRLCGDEALRHRIISNLAALPKGNENELQRYEDIML